MSTTARCGFDGAPACDIQEVIINPPREGGGGSGGIIWGPGDSPGGGCPEHQMCLDDGTGGGGGSSSTNIDPCVQANGPSSIATTNSTSPAFINSKTSISGMNNNLENGVVLGNVNNSIESTNIQMGGSHSISLTHSFSDPVADLHNHTNNNPPSVGDLYSLMEARNRFVNYNTRYIITVNGTTYALAVTNPSAMNSFLQNYPPEVTPNPNGGSFVNFPSSINDIYLDVYTYYNGTQEMALAYILDKYNAGVALTKMDSNGNFKKLGTIETVNPDGTRTYYQNNCQ